MSQEFQREARYAVFKFSKLNGPQSKILQEAMRKLPRVAECLVIESDWPECEPVWQMIEARMTAAPVPPTGVICDEVAPITEQDWRSLDSPPAGEVEVLDALKQLKAKAWHTEDNVSSALVRYDEVCELVEANVTRLQAERDGLRNQCAGIYQQLEICQKQRDHRQVELTKALSEVQRYKTMSDNYCALGMDANIELTKARELNSVAADDLHQASVRAILAEEQLSQYQCRHEWIDNGEDLLICPKCGKEDSDPEPFGWVQTSGPSINRFTQEWDVVEEWSDSGYEWVELFASEAHQSAPAVGEVEFLMKRATELKAERDALQSELAAGQELLEADRYDAERWRFFSVLANDLQAFPHSWGKMTPEKMNYMCDEAMNSAHQSAPAAKSIECSDCNGSLRATYSDNEHGIPLDDDCRSCAPAAKREHILYRDGDSIGCIPESILDRNGQVALDMCTVCGKAEAELNGPCEGAPAAPTKTLREEMGVSVEDWAKFKEWLKTKKSTPAVKCEVCDGTGHDLDGGINPPGGAADCLVCGGRAPAAKGGSHE